MNQEIAEVQHKSTEFWQIVDEALTEQKTDGSVSNDTHKKVCESFADVLIESSKNINRNFSAEMRNIIYRLKKKSDEYCCVSKRFMSINAIFNKLIMELTNEIKTHPSCPHHQ